MAGLPWAAAADWSLRSSSRPTPPLYDRPMLGTAAAALYVLAIVLGLVGTFTHSRPTRSRVVLAGGCCAIAMAALLVASFAIGE